MLKRSIGRITRLGSLLLVVLLCALPVTTFASETQIACYGYGDVNGDNGVDGRDAIYTLYHVLFPQTYPINQDCDFNEDGSVDSEDAIRILYGSLGMVPECDFGGTVHRYFEPEWAWTDAEPVSVTFRCGCGSSTVLTAADGITVEKQADAKQSCTDVGTVVYTAKVTLEGTEYSSTHTVTIPASGHTMSGTQSCLDSSTCTVCGYTVPAFDHNWVEDTARNIPATCQVPGVRAYKCSRDDCSETKIVELEGLAGHDYQYVQDIQVDGGCAYVKNYKCSQCEETSHGEPFYKHTYTVKLTREATCSTEGEKTYACACGYTKTDPVAKNDAHQWGDGVTGEDGMTTFTCSECDAVKTAILVQGNNAVVEKEVLAYSEIQLENAYVKLDEATLNELGETIQIDVGILPASEISLDSSHAEQIGSNPVYNFNLYSDESQVSGFAGKATVTLPYTLQAGDDVDCIDVWFISDSGEVSIVQGTYSNGFVSFTTDHFSYYTVTRLTPAQRCVHYGHAWGIDHQDSTCTQNGHHVVACRRCGDEQENTVLERLDHNYIETRVEATCTEPGSFEKICSDCLQKVKGELPALGHFWNLDVAMSTAPDCLNAGKDIYACGNSGCTESYADEMPALGHQYEMIGQVASDCTTSGYEGYKCAACGHEYKSNEVSPVGHDFAAESAIWEWDENCAGATVTLVCSRNSEHRQELNAVITKVVDAPNCNAGGNVVYNAVAAFNLKEYTDSKTVYMDKVGHLPGTQWLENTGVHYHECQSCKEMVDAAAHIWGETTVITAPTCSKSGIGKAVCTVCGYEKELTLNATGEHSFVGDVCDICHFDKKECSHLAVASEDLDLSAYDLCLDTRVYWESCDCGEYKNLYYDAMCRFGEETETEGILPNGKTGVIYTNTCADCGLVVESTWYMEVDEATCESQEAKWVRLSQNGTIIAENTNLYWEMMVQHNANIVVETIDLTEKGLCGVVLSVQRCHCGERVVTELKESECQWEYESIEGGRKSTCSVCSAIRTVTYTTNRDQENCLVVEESTNVYTLKDEEIYRYNNRYAWEEHAYELKDYRMDGDSCEDGIQIQQVCAVCHKDNSRYITWHETVDRKETEISIDGLCPDGYYEESCLCGQYSYFGLIYRSGNSCSQEYVSEDPESNTETWRCEYCGLIETTQTSYTEKDDNCQRQRIRKVTYTTAECALVAEGINKWENINHNMKATMELKGTSCEDGVKITEVCLDCGYTGSWNTKYHSVRTLESYDLTEYGMCGGTLERMGCACGYESWVDWNDQVCEWEWISTEHGTETYRCAACGVTRKEVESDRKEVGECRYERDISIAFIKNNKTLLKLGFVQTEHSHRYIYTFNLNGATCLDGYRVTETCQDCGETDNWSVNNETSHGTWAVKREMLVEGKLCGDLELVTYQCACGTYEGQNLRWVGDSCSYYSDEYVDAEDAWRYTCADCGGQKLEKGWQEKSDVPCSEKYLREVSYSKDGVELCHVTTTDITETHDWNYSYELLGDACSDGYRYTRTCADCGRTRTNSGQYYDCWSRQVEREVLLDHEDICGSVMLVTYDCACGKDRYTELEMYTCNWNYAGWETGRGETYVCDTCGLRRTGNETHKQQSGTCSVQATLNYTFSLDGEVLLSLNREVEQKNHKTVTTFEMDGKTCEDGYNMYSTCIYCGRERDNGYRFDHDIRQTAYYNLLDYGICGGEIWSSSCACGQNSGWDINIYECSRYATGNTSNGMEEYYCAKCETYRYTLNTGDHNPETCRWEGQFIAQFVRDGETILDISESYGYVSHNYLAESFELRNASVGCSAGYTANLVCSDCGDSYSQSGQGHGTYTVKYVDLTNEYPDSCGGEIGYKECACGQYSDVYYRWYCETVETDSWQKMEADGYTHEYYQERCPACGLERIADQVSILDAKNCKMINRYVYTFRQNDDLIGEYKRESTWDSHNFGETVCELLTGSVTCTDGVVYNRTCKTCGYVSQNRGNSHNLGLAESVDLTPYGSVCGGNLNLYACACGQRQRYDFAQDAQCDVDKKYISNFMPGTIDTAQHTTEGYVYTYSDSYMMTCAVTSPQCSLKIRMSEYWLEEDCMATEYQIWQLGYDEATGTCQKELKIATGEQHAYHQYVSGSSTETLADGTEVHISTQTCSKCASSYIVKNHYLNGTQTKYERIATNTKDNGERKRYYDVDEYGVENSGYRYITLERIEYTNADDSEYWQQYAHTYNFAGGCMRTTAYTDVNGAYHVYVNDAHNTTWSREYVKDSTCTQFGEYIGRWTCEICGEITGEYSYDVNPIAHNWDYDSGKETDVCTICGLENINGASGSIVLEDMTADYGNGTNYVVGYWNRDDVEARKYVGVILDENDFEELVLTDIVFMELTAQKDSITAISFSQAEVQTAAAAAMAEKGYTGSYAIRFAFVPVGSEDTLDYAITFDSQTT